MLSCSAAKQPIERNAAHGTSERCTWKIKPPSTTCSAPGRNDSALGFANLYSLTEKYGTQIALEDGVLYVRQLDRIPGAVAYYPPLGTLDIADDVRTLMREAQAEGRRLHLVGLSPKEKEQLEADLPGAFEFSSDRNFADYLYLTKTIAAYEGRAWRRSAERRTSPSMPAARRPSSPSPSTIWTSCAPTSRFGSTSAVAAPTSTLELEHRKILLDMNHFEGFDLKASSAHGGTVEGYAYGSVLPGGAFDVMVLKGNLDSFRGAPFCASSRATASTRRPTSTWKRISACPACARTS
ncbi:MAG: phosphatidylglycerol lysyltransferase domain-containing protein [Adlercreutzia sp.]